VGPLTWMARFEYCNNIKVSGCEAREGEREGNDGLLTGAAWRALELVRLMPARTRLRSICAMTLAPSASGAAAAAVSAVAAVFVAVVAASAAAVAAVAAGAAAVGLAAPGSVVGAGSDAGCGAAGSCPSEPCSRAAASSSNSFSTVCTAVVSRRAGHVDTERDTTQRRDRSRCSPE
jgi:hypothetical protein